MVSPAASAPPPCSRYVAHGRLTQIHAGDGRSCVLIPITQNPALANSTGSGRPTRPRPITPARARPALDSMLQTLRGRSDPACHAHLPSPQTSSLPLAQLRHSASSHRLPPWLPRDVFASTAYTVAAEHPRSPPSQAQRLARPRAVSPTLSPTISPPSGVTATRASTWPPHVPLGLRPHFCS